MFVTFEHHHQSWYSGWELILVYRTCAESFGAVRSLGHNWRNALKHWADWMANMTSPRPTSWKNQLNYLTYFREFASFFVNWRVEGLVFLFVGKKRTNIELLSDSNIDKHKHPFKTFFDRIRHDILVMSVKWLDSVTWKLWPHLWRK